jgi:hypothetical protein
VWNHITEFNETFLFTCRYVYVYAQIIVKEGKYVVYMHAYIHTYIMVALFAAPAVTGFSWAKCNATSTYYSTSHTICLGEKDAPGKAAKNHARA